MTASIEDVDDDVAECIETVESVNNRNNAADTLRNMVSLPPPIVTSTVPTDDNNFIVPSSPSLSTKSSKLKFWFLSDNASTNKSNIDGDTQDANAETPPVPSNTALVLIDDKNNTTKGTNLKLKLPKNLIHNTVQKQRSVYYQQLHDIELQVSLLNAQFADDCMNFDSDIHSCMADSNTYSFLYRPLRQKSQADEEEKGMNVYSFLQKYKLHKNQSTSASLSARNEEEEEEEDPAPTMTSSPSSSSFSPSSVLSNHQHWMIYEQRLSSLDAQMTHSIHVELSDLKQSHFYTPIQDLVYHKFPNDILQVQCRDYHTKQEQYMIQQWEGIVGLIARHYAEERATRIVAYQTILEQIQSSKRQFQNEMKQVNQQLHDRSKNDSHNGLNPDTIDISTMKLIDPNHPPQDPNANEGNLTTSAFDLVPTSTTLTTVSDTTTTGAANPYRTILNQIASIQLQILHEQRVRKEQDEQLRALLLHRTEVLQQAILETFE
jgi:hypothetical protein